MPLRITTLSLDGEAITDIPDGQLVLDMYYRYVKPEPQVVVMLYKNKCANLSREFDADELESKVDTTSGVDILQVSHVSLLKYTDLPIIHIDNLE